MSGKARLSALTDALELAWYSGQAETQEWDRYEDLFHSIGADLDRLAANEKVIALAEAHPILRHLMEMSDAELQMVSVALRTPAEAKS
jgi:hypothetical protein